MMDKLRSYAKLTSGRSRGCEEESVIPPMVPDSLPPTPPPTPPSTPESIIVKPCALPAPAPQNLQLEPEKCQRLASLFSPQGEYLGLPLALFLNLEWRERRNISKTCKLYYRLWYTLDLTPRIMHDGAFGAEVGATKQGMTFQCVVDMYGQGRGGFEYVSKHLQEPAISSTMVIYPCTMIQRFRPWYMKPSERRGIESGQTLKLNAPSRGNNYVTPSGCFLFNAQWFPARHAPEQDGIIESWSISPFANNNGSFTICDLVQIATLHNSTSSRPHPVPGFEPFKNVSTQWAGLHPRPPLPNLPPGFRKLRFKTEHANITGSALKELNQEILLTLLDEAENHLRECQGVCCAGPSKPRA